MSINKQPISFKIASVFYFSHFKCLLGQHNTVTGNMVPLICGLSGHFLVAACEHTNIRTSENMGLDASFLSYVLYEWRSNE
jgi:hypothetical protein